MFFIVLVKKIKARISIASTTSPDGIIIQMDTGLLTKYSKYIPVSTTASPRNNNDNISLNIFIYTAGVTIESTPFGNNAFLRSVYASSSAFNALRSRYT